MHSHGRDLTPLVRFRSQKVGFGYALDPTAPRPQLIQCDNDLLLLQTWCSSSVCSPLFSLLSAGRYGPIATPPHVRGRIRRFRKLSPCGPEVRFVFRHEGFAARQVSVWLTVC